MEQIPEPDRLFPQSAGAGAGRKRLPGHPFLTWLGVVAAAAGLHFLRSAAASARASRVPWAGAAIDAVAVSLALGLAVVVWVVVARRNW